MKEEPPTSAKCRDKFLVQSCLITPERETTSLQDIWGVVEKTDKSSIHEQKIRCAFLPAATAPVMEEGEDQNGSYMTNGGDEVSLVKKNWEIGILWRRWDDARLCSKIAKDRGFAWLEWIEGVWSIRMRFEKVLENRNLLEEGRGNAQNLLGELEIGSVSAQSLDICPLNGSNQLKSHLLTLLIFASSYPSRNMLLFVELQTDLPLPTTIPPSLLQSKDPLHQTEPIQLLQLKMQLETPMEPLPTRSRLEL